MSNAWLVQIRGTNKTNKNINRKSKKKIGVILLNYLKMCKLVYKTMHN